MKLQRLSPRVPTLRGPVMQALSVDRIRGRKAVERRKRWLYLHPLCVECEKEGKVTTATVPDHVFPIWAGGQDDLERNGQSLCTEHHDAKSACEARMRAAGGWLSTPCTCGQHG